MESGSDNVVAYCINLDFVEPLWEPIAQNTFPCAIDLYSSRVIIIYLEANTSLGVQPDAKSGLQIQSFCMGADSTGFTSIEEFIRPYHSRLDGMDRSPKHLQSQTENSFRN